MKKKNILGGLLLILLASIIVLNKVNVLPDLPWTRMIAGVFMAYLVIISIPKLNFFGIIMPLCVIGCLFDTELGIEAITPGTLLIAGVLVSGGLALIFKRKKNREFKMVIDENEKTMYEEDGQIIHLENNFNSVSKYVNTAAFSEAYIENHFGSCNVYFNNATMQNQSAKIELDNNFGQMNLYFPKNWRVNIRQNTVGGPVKIYGEPNRDMDAPHLEIDVDNVFGRTNIYFE